jgi:FKBP-type peptidyl-prolyl cis-trans isomerase FkpA
MKYRILKLIVTTVVGAALLTSCFKDDIPSAEEVLKSNLENVDKTQLEKDLKVIDDSLEQWSIFADQEPNGVRYVINSIGFGPKPTLTSNIYFTYKGMLLKDKSVFDQGTTSYPLSGLIIGWQTTLPLLPEGTNVTLYIPSGYGYGNYEIKDQDGAVKIPANSNLIFNIEILDVF